MSISVSVNGNIQISDGTTGETNLATLLNAISFTGFEAKYSNILLANGLNTLVIANPTQFLFLKNLHAANTVTVAWTPTGGAPAPIFTLVPGGSIMFCNPTAGGGITTLTLTASGAATPMQMVLGA